MSIKFLCAHCKKVISVKDEFAGRKGKCPHCATILTVPMPGVRPAPTTVKPPPAPPPPKKDPTPPLPKGPLDLEAEAAAAFADEPKADVGPAPTTIDFSCPMCDAELHLPLALAGKREPCPECKRIIKVPEPVKKDPTNWRQAAPNLPSAARRPEEKAPEGAWSTAGAATVSRESLQDAGAIPEAPALLTVRQRIVRYSLWSVGVVLAVAACVLGYFRWVESRGEQGVEAALTYADSEAGKAELGAAGRAAVYRLAGAYYLRTGQAGSAERASKMFGKSHGNARLTGETSEHDAILQELAVAVVELGGTPQQVDAGLKAPWDEVQKDLRSDMAEVRSNEARLEALRAVARRLAVLGEGKRATALAYSLYSTPNQDQAEALGAVGLVLQAAGKKDLAAEAADKAAGLYAPSPDRPALAPAAVALAVALGREPPEPSKRPSKWTAPDATADALGRAEGLARSSQWDAARQMLPLVKNMAPDALLRANVALAAADLDDKTAANADVAAAFLQAQAARATPSSPWLLLRLTRIGAQAAVSPDSIRPVADLIGDRDLHGRAQLAALEAQFDQAKQAVDVKAVDSVDPQTLSARLARTLWAWRTPGSASVVKAWDSPNRAFGQIGAALRTQGER